MQNVVLAVVGVILATASGNGLIANLLSPAMQWPTAVSGLVLIVLALLGSFRGLSLAELGAEQGDGEQGDTEQGEVEGGSAAPARRGRPATSVEDGGTGADTSSDGVTETSTDGATQAAVPAVQYRGRHSAVVEEEAGGALPPGSGRRGRHDRRRRGRAGSGRATPLAALRHRRADRPGRSGRARRRPAGLWLAWTFAVPFVVLGALTPEPLGLYAARHLAASPLLTMDSSAPAALTGNGPISMTLSDYTRRAMTGDGLSGHVVVLTGFVVGGASSSQSWTLTRLAIQTGAAGAVPVMVEVLGVQAYPEGVWVTVTGTWVKGTVVVDGRTVAQLQAASVVAVPVPDHPYEQR